MSRPTINSKNLDVIKDRLNEFGACLPQKLNNKILSFLGMDKFLFIQDQHVPPLDVRIDDKLVR